MAIPRDNCSRPFSQNNKLYLSLYRLTESYDRYKDNVICFSLMKSWPTTKILLRIMILQPGGQFYISFSIVIVKLQNSEGTSALPVLIILTRKPSLWKLNSFASASRQKRFARSITWAYGRRFMYVSSFINSQDHHLLY